MCGFYFFCSSYICLFFILYFLIFFCFCIPLRCLIGLLVMFFISLLFAFSFVSFFLFISSFIFIIYHSSFFPIFFFITSFFAFSFLSKLLFASFPLLSPCVCDSYFFSISLLISVSSLLLYFLIFFLSFICFCIPLSRCLIGLLVLS